MDQKTTRIIASVVMAISAAVCVALVYFVTVLILALEFSSPSSESTFVGALFFLLTFPSCLFFDAIIAILINSLLVALIASVIVWYLIQRLA
ncbi:MAG: hypothetical protein RIG82_05650 [Phycisphaeraceae bacterium]